MKVKALVNGVDCTVYDYTTDSKGVRCAVVRYPYFDHLATVPLSLIKLEVEN